MRTTTQMSITLPNEMANAVRARVKSGEYASESEVIRDGLRALVARERAFEHWLATEAAAAYDELEANPWGSHPSKCWQIFPSSWAA